MSQPKCITTCLLIRFHLFLDTNLVAEQYVLQGYEVKVTMSTVNGNKESLTKLFVVELFTTFGGKILIQAVGMENMSGKTPSVIMNGVKHLFSEEAQSYWHTICQRPWREVQLLVGSEVAGLHPLPTEVVDNLFLTKSMFGQTWALYGYHLDNKSGDVSFCHEVNLIRAGAYKVLECSKIAYTPILT